MKISQNNQLLIKRKYKIGIYLIQLYYIGYQVHQDKITRGVRVAFIEYVPFFVA